mmetsp:Transcript_81550/g.141687  ORF Transcript_81550/g.141687 Transcript_81550/m.141687 type:complete len:499 (+) Transcript_81550:65-1561(+)
MLRQKTVCGTAALPLLLGLTSATCNFQGTNCSAEQGHTYGLHLLQLKAVFHDVPGRVTLQSEVYSGDTGSKSAGIVSGKLGLFSTALNLDAPDKFGQNLPRDIGLCAIAFCVAGVSLAAGVGGGGLFVPLLMIVLSLSSKIATSLSQAALFGGALSAFVYNMQCGHPSRPARPLINFELACLIGSALVAGAQVGSVVHAFAPPALILLLLCIVLIQSAWKGVNNGLKIQAKEAELKSLGEAAGQLGEARGPAAEKPLGVEAEAEDEHLSQVLSHTFQAQMRLFLTWLLCMALVVSKGLLVEICSPMWWFLTVAATLILFGLAYSFASKFSEQEPVDEDDLDFRELAFPLMRISLFSGALAALCGIGGGMVMGPILVEMKVPPQVSSATTATTLIVLSSSTALVYLCRGVAPLDYTVVLFFCTLAGAMIGKLAVGWWVKRTGKQSLIVWTLVIVTVLSTLLMGYEGLSRIREMGWSTFKFTSVCPDASEVPGEPILGAE